jgi:chemotaxis protein MotB
VKEQRPIIIIKKKGGGHGGHHGGAWKVAYADFVTAMMAFFLVMWLVSQSKEVRASIGGYFRDPGVFDYEKSTGMLPGGQPTVQDGRGTESVSDAAAIKREEDILTEAADHIRANLLNATGLAALRDQIEFTLTTEGLRIELVERSGSSFFDSGSAVLRGESVAILGIIAEELTRLTNDVVVEGHTDSRPFADGERYGNWELSADRANAARRAMEASGLGLERVQGVRGFADTRLRNADDPLDAANRRISIVVRSQAAADMERAVRAAK